MTSQTLTGQTLTGQTLTGQTLTGLAEVSMEAERPLKVVLIGASVRPLIASCLRAGYVPVAFDFFADWDGQQLLLQSGYANASLTKIERYEDLLELDFAKLGDVAILAGGAELQPELVTAVGEQLPLSGPSVQSLATISDPLQWLSRVKKRRLSRTRNSKRLTHRCHDR